MSGEQSHPEEDQKESLSKAARIRAARQRRYGKKAAGVSDTAQEEATLSAKPVPVAIEAKTTEAEAIVDPPAGSEANHNIVTDVTPEPTAEVVKEIVDSTTGDSDIPVSSEPKKKYMGVARTRRNLIKKKKQEDASGGTSSDPSTSVTSPDVSEVKKISRDPLRVVLTLPIYMHIFTVVLLFLAGVDISFQEYNQQLEVHSNLAFNQHGLPFVNRRLGPTETSEKADLGLMQLTEENSASGGAGLLDEFQDEEIFPVGQNIDPLFGVDLDELTKGPGVMNQLARGAVAAHRTVLWFAYYFPRSILQSLFSLPAALLHSPPVLCVLALILRHLVGKGILGAGIPDRANVDEKASTIDVLAMAKNFVSNFLASNFPMAVSLYEAFTHLRSDMYVLLCGVFVGLVLTRWSASSIPSPDVQSEFQANDEL